MVPLRFAGGAGMLRMPTLSVCGKPSSCCPNTAEVKKEVGHEHERLVSGFEAGH
jgi:hypothetical protein